MNKSMIFGALLGASLGLGSAQAAETVKIGVLTDLSGPDSDMAGQGSVVAAQMAVEDAGGTVAGR